MIFPVGINEKVCHELESIPSEMVQEKSVRHLLQLSPSEQREFLESFDFVFSDCDGVIWSLTEPLPKTGQALNLLKNSGKQVKFVTNNSFTTNQQYREKFQRISLQEFQIEDVIHPIRVISEFLKLHKPNRKVYSIASWEANETLKENNIEVETLNIDEHMTPSSLMPYLKLDPRVGAVVFDINLDLTYAQVAKAIEYLARTDCLLLCGGADKHLPFSPTFLAPGFADYLQHIQNYSGKEAIMFGKPTDTLVATLKEMFQITDPKRCLFIGDTLVQDIGFGKKCGFQTLLVLSGTTTKEAMLQAPDHQTPDFYANGLKDFIELYQNIDHS